MTVGPLRGLAPGESAQARQHLAEVERLHEVVVRAGVEAADAVLHVVARGQHQDRHPLLVAAQLTADREPVLAGEHHVEDDGVVVVGARLRERLVAGHGEIDGIPLALKPALQCPQELRIVLYNKQSHPVPIYSLGVCADRLAL